MISRKKFLKISGFGFPATALVVNHFTKTVPILTLNGLFDRLGKRKKAVEAAAAQAKIEENLKTEIGVLNSIAGDPDKINTYFSNLIPTEGGGRTALLCLGFSSGQEFGTDNRLHSVIVTAIFNWLKSLNFDFTKLSEQARIYFVQLQIAEPSAVGINEETLAHHPDRSLQSRYNKDIKGTELTIDFDKLKSNAQNMLVVPVNDAEEGTFNHYMTTKRANTHNKETYEWGNIYTSNTNPQIKVYVLKHDLQDLPTDLPDTFGVINLKGHGGDMSGLLEKVKSKVDPNATIVFAGGCSSNHITPNALKLKALPVTNKSIGQSAINDYFSVLIQLVVSKSKTFEEALSEVKGMAKSNYPKFYFPTDKFTERYNTLCIADGN